MSSKSIEERLDRVERLLAGEVEAVDVAIRKAHFFDIDHSVHPCKRWYSDACQNGDYSIQPPADIGPVCAIGSMRVRDLFVCLEDGVWKCYRITAKA